MARVASQLNAPFLKSVRFDPTRAPGERAYPFDLGWLKDDFELRFEAPVTVLVGENGTGKSTLIEALAALAGFDEAGGGPGYRPVDHSQAIARGGGALAQALRASWLPLVKTGWFFKAESFFSVARYLDQAALDAHAPPPDYLSHSHGEGFLRFIDERLSRRGVYFFDEPESALSPRRQLEFMRILDRMAGSGQSQAIMATHSPLLMALPGARLMRLTRGEIAPVKLEEIEHFRLLRAFCADPDGFVREKMADDV